MTAAEQMYDSLREQLLQAWERYWSLLQLKAPPVIIENEAALLVQTLANIHGLGNVLKNIGQSVDRESRLGYGVCVMEGCPNPASPDKEAHSDYCLKCLAEIDSYLKQATLAEE